MATSIIDTNSEEPHLYHLIKELCSVPCRARGPEIDLETLCTNPDHRKECMDHVMTGSQETFSLYISELMDGLGYSYDMIKYRQRMYAENYKLLKYENKSTCVVVGSKGEGTALLFESDTDIMLILPDVVCVDNIHHSVTQEENITLFQAERCELFPGYTKLKLLKHEAKSSGILITESMCKSENGMYYLSSHLIGMETRKIQTGNNNKLPKDLEVKEQRGPSLPVSFKFKHFDQVNCLRCYCTDIVERWVTRHRRHGWPTQDIIHNISLLDGHVVPVGFKGSPNFNVEWRICYTLAELHLMRTFNETQIKVYILLKKISKSVLYPVCHEITSYIIKTVVFWVSEKVGVQTFRPNLLMHRIFDCLEYLKTCVVENNLPSYMIPERDLLAGRLNFQQRQELRRLLNDLLQEGNRMLLRCNKIRDALILMYKAPEMLTDFGEKRDKIERLILYCDTMRKETGELDMTLGELTRLVKHNENYRYIWYRIVRLIPVDVQLLRQEGRSDKETDDRIYTKLSQILS